MEDAVSDTSRETVLIGGVEKREIKIVDYDAEWPHKYAEHEKKIRRALGERVFALEHVGSTAVPNLAAKPIIDIDLIVADSSDESSYLPALEEAGYVLRVREPDWHEHRMVRTPALDVHIHIFSPDSPEFRRHTAFREWLKAHDADRRAYESVKRELASKDWEDMNAYAAAKSEIVERILASAFQG
ncbi:MAG: GrpB family protein [Planctomycetota bacterium]